VIVRQIPLLFLQVVCLVMMFMGLALASPAPVFFMEKQPVKQVGIHEAAGFSSAIVKFDGLVREYDYLTLALKKQCKVEAFFIDGIEVNVLSDFDKRHPIESKTVRVSAVESVSSVLDQLQIEFNRPTQDSVSKIKNTIKITGLLDPGSYRLKFFDRYGRSLNHTILVANMNAFGDVWSQAFRSVAFSAQSDGIDLTIKKSSTKLVLFFPDELLLAKIDSVTLSQYEAGNRVYVNNDEINLSLRPFFTSEPQDSVVLTGEALLNCLASIHTKTSKVIYAPRRLLISQWSLLNIEAFDVLDQVPFGYLVTDSGPTKISNPEAQSWMSQSGYLFSPSVSVGLDVQRVDVAQPSISIRVAEDDSTIVVLMNSFHRSAFDRFFLHYVCSGQPHKVELRHRYAGLFFERMRSNCSDHKVEGILRVSPQVFKRASSMIPSLAVVMSGQLKKQTIKQFEDALEVHLRKESFLDSKDLKKMEVIYSLPR
jgi:hypothetical protein